MTVMLLASLCVILLSLARVNVGDNTDNLFILPTAPGPSNNFVADLSWTLGSNQKIQWSTFVDSYYIALFQQATDPASGHQLDAIFSVGSGGSGQQSFNWKVQTYNSDLSFSPVYFLWLNPGDPQGFTSHYFNITNHAQGSSSSSSSSSGSSSSSSSSTSSSLSTAVPSPSSSITSVIASSTLSTALQRSSDTASAPPSSATSSNTETVKVGLGVGLGIGIPLVLIGGIWIGLKSVKQRRSSSRSMGSGVPLSHMPDEAYPPISYPPPNESVHHANQIHEAPGKIYEVHEAPGGQVLIELGTR